MVLRCERCNDELDPVPSGLLAKLGITGADGYECPGCGAVLCEECYRRRRREMGGARHDLCPVCGTMLEHR